MQEDVLASAPYIPLDRFLHQGQKHIILNFRGGGIYKEGGICPPVLN